MSKWGIEEIETQNKMYRLRIKGSVLNIATGDGRFNEILLKLADSVVGIIDKSIVEKKKIIFFSAKEDGGVLKK